MGVQRLVCGNWQMLLSDATIEEAEAAPAGEQLSVSGESRFVTFGAVKVEATRSGTLVWRRYLYEPGGRAGVRERSALCDDERLFLIVGRMVACLDLSTGALNWVCEGDDSSCFGLYRAPGADALIVHYELEVARISWAGHVEWRAAGRDIFTGPFRLEQDAIYATDWNGDAYRITYQTGDIAIVGYGKPFPH